ncbi:hypothetical protein B0H13DRAFT_1636050 [Mycena leptocephala]|nr:hypothetical protein B0H13DRAFT_1636050 [Mycena leptocephala]
MRSIVGYIAIVALAATQGTGIPRCFKPIFLTCNFSQGCGDNAYRCVNPNGSVEDDWNATKACMDKVGITNTCYCSHRAETYADPDGNNIQKFKDCCDATPNYGWREC